jgi:hypothetical protein
LRRLLLIFILLFAGVSWLGWTYRVKIVSEVLTHNLGVSTTVEDVEISTHGFIVRGLCIGCSKDPKPSPVLHADYVRVTFQPLIMLKEPRHISEIAIDGVYVILDIGLFERYSANWGKLFKKLKEKAKVVSNESGHAVIPKPEKGYVIDHIVITNIHVTMEKRSMPLLPGSIPAVARLELYDIGKESPRTIKQIAELILGAVLEQATGSHPQLSALTDTVINNGDEELKKVLKSIKKQFHDTDVQGMWKKVQSFFEWGQ